MTIPVWDKFGHKSGRLFHLSISSEESPDTLEDLSQQRWGDTHISICIRYFWQLPDDCSARSMKLWVAINVFDQIIQLCKSIYIYILTCPLRKNELANYLLSPYMGVPPPPPGLTIQVIEGHSPAFYVQLLIFPLLSSWSFFLEKASCPTIAISFLTLAVVLNLWLQSG